MVKNTISKPHISDLIPTNEIEFFYKGNIAMKYVPISIFIFYFRKLGDKVFVKSIGL